MIEYLTGPYETIERPVPRSRGILQSLPGQNEMGYGSKITTDTMIRVDGRLHRVYATCWSNAASCWITKNGKRLFLRN